MRGSVGSPNRREKKQPTTKNQYIFKNARDHTNLGRTHMSNIVWDLFRENMFCFSDMFRIIFRKVSEAYLELSKQYVLHASKHVPDNFKKSCFIRVDFDILGKYRPQKKMFCLCLSKCSNAFFEN